MKAEKTLLEPFFHVFYDFGPPTTRWGKGALICCFSLFNEAKWEARCCKLAIANSFLTVLM